MNIVVFGAAGKVGSRVVEEALSRGHRVTAAVRDPAKIARRHPSLAVVKADAFDPESVAAAARGHDVAINAIAPTEPGDGMARAARSLRKGLLAAGVGRLLIVGGAASLEVSPGVLLRESIPEEWRWIVDTHILSLAEYRTMADIDWGFLSPSAELEPGVRTGKYRLGKDTLLSGPDGKSYISMEDLAVVLVDEAETPRHHRERFTAVRG